MRTITVRTHHRALRRNTCLLLSSLVVACGSAGGVDDGSATGEGAGATTSSAGGTSSTGGTTAHGGATSTGGASAGTSALGGSQGNPTGGSTGGTSLGTGGAAAHAGASPIGTGGAAATGGMTSSTGGSNGVCAANAIICNGNTAEVCDGNGGFLSMMDCPVVCLAGVGCAMCDPGAGSCDADGNAVVCNADGSAMDTTPCDPAYGCMNGQCGTACAGAGVLKRSNVGCEYYPTVTSNSQLSDSFDFAVVVANTTSVPANVTISQGGMMLNQGQIAPGMLATATLPWVTALKHKMLALSTPSALVPQGAFHVVSDQPVTVFQFNPLEYEIPQVPACALTAMFGKCFSYTNDASIVLPTNGLGTEYIVASHAAAVIQSSDGSSVSAIPGFVTITAVVDGTTVTFTSTAYTVGGTGVKAMSPGDTQMFAMNAGDVVQIMTATPNMSDVLSCDDSDPNEVLCDVPNTYDLTGSSITSDKNIGVIGGHDCDFIPYNKPACDHIEETLFPVATWGKQAITAPAQSVVGAKANDGTPDLHGVRVISGIDGNTISFDPTPPGAPTGVLNKGQWADIPPTSMDFVVTGTGPIMVAEYMLGANLVDAAGAASGMSQGDPSLSLAIPAEQFRSDYTFLAPSTYITNFVNIIAPAGEVVMLDGVAVTSPPPATIGSSGYTVTRKAIAGTPHTMTAAQPFGIVVYGYGSYTSYMYPGGLDLNNL